MGDWVTATWGAKRKRMLFGRREEEQTQWVVRVTGKRGQRKRREEQTPWVVGMTDKRKGQRERGCYSVGQRADMIIFSGSAQPKKSESLNQTFSQSLKKRRNFFTGLVIV